MNTTQTETEKSTGMPEWYDPFEEKRTIPSGWDLSGLFPTEQDAD